MVATMVAVELSLLWPLPLLPLPQLPPLPLLPAALLKASDPPTDRARNIVVTVLPPIITRCL